MDRKVPKPGKPAIASKSAKPASAQIGEAPAAQHNCGKASRRLYAMEFKIAAHYGKHARLYEGLSNISADLRKR